MKKEDQILWFLLFVTQGLFCIMILISTYGDEFTKLFGDPKVIVEPVQYTPVTLPMTLKQQQLLQEHVLHLKNSNATSDQIKDISIKKYSLLILYMVSLSVILEVMLLWRIKKRVKEG